MPNEHYEFKALLFAEKHGIIDYKVEGNLMIWEEVLRNEGTFLHTYNLDTMNEDIKKIKKAYWEE